ncbi:related to glu/asp-tRNA amidotransferase subunit A [Rhynchosporium agropyri]|uniref:Related to glu/asp-tRNA amidotransferase subunit A n=1 Tax=Rhynchosporium agropyri TaxID=914238 RepID=A0A1E1KX57_9HELO|nr:related to glu/asp-tRNA amidotransferase subunit A [Rhynchosporium agropyri]
MASLSIFQAGIAELQHGLAIGALTSVDLVSSYLRRISTYDQGGDGFNAIPIINTAVFDEAAASDDLRLSGAKLRPLEGIPYIIKDSYKYKGLTVAAGSPAFQHLIANEDARAVELIREAGAVMLGKTNMPPMAEGGMQVGVYGRAESSYNRNYLAAAWGSGSSNGAGVSITSSFAAFGLGEETFSSGRSPASNNALIAYTPSRGVISVRGNWPLYPTHDVVVPMTTSMDDMLTLIDILAVEDPLTAGDFWRDQPYLKLPKAAGVKGQSAHRRLKYNATLDGIRVAVPVPYFGGPQFPGSEPVTISDGVVQLLKQVRSDLEALGAIIVELPDFPLVSLYSNASLRAPGAPSLPANWWSGINGSTGIFNGLMAHSWNTFLKFNKDPYIPNLAATNLSDIWPFELLSPTEQKQLQASGRTGNRYATFANITATTDYYGFANLSDSLYNLEAMREVFLHDWLDQNNCSFTIFPSQGDVSSANSDVNDNSFNYTALTGIWFANGGESIRVLGVPTVTVPMGLLPGKQMPMGLTFAGKAYDDTKLLSCAYAYEQKSLRRIPPKLVPELPSDIFPLFGTRAAKKAARPQISVEAINVTNVLDPDMMRVTVRGSISPTSMTLAGYSVSTQPIVSITVGTFDIPSPQLKFVKAMSNATLGEYHFEGWAEVPKPVDPGERFKTWAPVARDKTMVLILARAEAGGMPSGFVEMI